MGKHVVDTTKISDQAESASMRIDVVRQFCIPDLEKLLRSAYYHGYRDALLEHRCPVGKPESKGETK